MQTAIPVAKPYFGIEEELAVAEVLRSGWVTQGPRVETFEREFAAYVGAAHAIAVSNCTTALHLALVAYGVRAGDEVICPSYSFIATANAIRHAGATPVFADISPVTFNIDVASVAACVTSRTKAIMPVHQAGMPADMAPLREFADQNGFALIEDAACAIGSTYRGEPIGRPVGDVACFSFHPRKVLSTGDGGMLTTNDEAVAARLKRLRQHAMSLSDVARHASRTVVFEHYDEVGYNYRLTDLQAAVGLVQLGRLPAFLAQRNAIARLYNEAFAGSGYLEVPTVPIDRTTNWQTYLLRLNEACPIDRNDLMNALLDRGISTRRGIMCIHQEEPYRGAARRALPESEAAAESTIVLPIYHEMSADDAATVVNAIKELVRE